MTQLLLIALLILLLFMGPTLIRRWRGVLTDKTKPGDEGDDTKSSKKGGGQPAVQDLVACPTCGVYGPRPAPTCERDDCPGRR